MLIFIALGGTAVFPRGRPMAADRQRASVRSVAEALAPIAGEHQLVVGYGNGPQVGLLAQQGAAYGKVETCPLDVLTVHAEETIGYMLQQELRNLLPCERPLATLTTMVEVDPEDPAFKKPTTFIGPVYLRDEAERLARDKGWVFKPDGDKWRRVVASPAPTRVFELGPIRWLLERNTIVIAAGGGGLPAMYSKGAERTLTGVDCVIDKDLAAELLARELGADLFVMLTDADAVYIDWGRSTPRAIRRASLAALRAMSFAAGSIGPKVDAACRFAHSTGKAAAIGALADLGRIIARQAGTTISVAESGITYAPATDALVSVSPS